LDEFPHKVKAELPPAEEELNRRNNWKYASGSKGAAFKDQEFLERR